MVDAINGAGPDPGGATDLAEFIELLGRLRIWAGAPSYRTLAKRVGPLLRPPQHVSQSTITDTFQTRRRRLNLDLVVAIVRALGLDEAAVARWRSACVAVHAQAKTGGLAGVFRQLPADLSTFTGRTEELGRLIDASTRRGAAGPPTVVISAIEGMGGIGKTQLAVHAAHHLVRAGHYSDVQLYVNLRGFDAEMPPTDPGVVLDAFLRQLEVPAQQIPDRLDERAAMFRHRMEGRNALILLDNVFDERQVRDLIPAGPECLVLITSRRSLAGLDGAILHTLDVFSEAEAVDLLARIVGADRIAAEPEVARQIVKTCGCLPLAVTLAASRLRTRPAWTLTNLAERLSRGGLDALSAGDRSLRRVFDVSYQELPEQARSMFRMLGLWTGKDIDLHAAAALLGCTGLQAEHALDVLVDAHLLQSPSPDRYQFHDLLHTYACELANVDEESVNRHRAIVRVLTWYLHASAAAMDCIAPQRRPIDLQSEWTGPALLPTFESRPAAVAWCDVERANLVDATGLAVEHGLNDIAWQIPTSLQYYFHTNMRIDDFIASHLTGLQAARRTESAEGEARLSQGLASAYRIVGRFDEAIRIGTQLPPLYRRVGDLQGESAALSSLAQTYQQSGDNLPAVDLYLKSIEVGRLGGLHIAAEINNLGITYHALRRYDEALSSFQEALRASIDGDRRDTQAAVLGSLGQLAATRDDHRQAIDYFEQAIRLQKANGERVYLAEILEDLARSHQALGNRREAAETLLQAQEIIGKLGLPDGAALSRITMSPVQAGEKLS